MDELQQAQERLGRALDRAQAGGDPRLAGQVRERGEQLANLLSGLLRLSRVHAPDNRAFDQPVAELRNALTRLMELVGTIHLVAIDDQVYVNEIRIRQPPQQQEGRHLGAELGQHNVGGISFHQTPEEAQLRTLVKLFTSRPAPRSPRKTLQHALRAAGVEGVELAVLHRFLMAGEEAESTVRVDPHRIAARVVKAVNELWDNLAAGRRPSVLPLRRLVTEVLKAGPGAEGFFWDVPGASPHALHALRIAQYALIIGLAAGLDEGVLQDLGVAALVHDVGYASSRPEAHQDHPLSGARMLLSQVGFHEAKIRRVLATLEHHRDVKDAHGTPTLFGRILRIVEDYENLVRKGGSHLPPTSALGTLATGSGSRYDPVLLQLFINRMGYYPPGSILELEDHRFVRTLSLVRGPETFMKPRAAVVRLADGSRPSQFQLVDLAHEGKVARVHRPS